MAEQKTQQDSGSKPRLPCNYVPRPYQERAFDTITNGYKRGVFVWHRRAGKDKTAINLVAKEMHRRIGAYYYLFPKYNQGRKILWDGIDRDGFPFMNHIPMDVRLATNNTEMKIKMKNGSLFQIIGSDNYDTLVGPNPVGIVLSEYALQDPRAYEFMRPILVENNGWAIFLYTPRGHNHGYELYKTARKNPRWFCQLLTVDDTRAIRKEDIEQEKKEGMSEDLVQQEFYCFPSNVDVIKQDGVSFIKDIKVGDFVLTHGNRYRKVKKVFRRKYIGTMLRIKTLASNKDIVCTPTHPIRICNDGVNNFWKPAKELLLTDRLTFPKLCPRKLIFVKEEIVRLIGWYITEGSINKGSVMFTLNIAETKYQNEIISIAKDLGYEPTVSINKQNNTKTVYINSQELIEFMVKNCGSGAENKKIPFDLISGREEIFYDVMISGDGIRFEKRGQGKRDIYTTISKTLAYQFQMLAHQLGFGASLSLRAVAGKGMILGREVNIKDNYVVNVYSGGEKIKSHKYNISVPIVSIKKEVYWGYVYNLSVFYDESYTVNGRVVHNCSFEASIPGAYFATEMGLMEQQGRICRIPIESGIPVNTFWDLGIDDSMTIWLMQLVGKEPRLIGYYENSGEGFVHYVNWLKDWRDSKGLTFGKHILPHDAMVRELQTGKSRLDFLKELRLDCDITVRPKTKEDGIAASRQMLGRVWIDEVECEKGIEALRQYRKEYNSVNGVYATRPVHDKNKHGADSFQTLSLWWQQYVPKIEPRKPAQTAIPQGVPPEQSWML